MRLNLKLKDWQKRAIKTFVQAFFGVLIPETVWILGNIESVGSVSAAKAILVPTVCSALSAGISAVWNICLEVLTPPAVPCEDSEVVQEGDDGGDV